MSTADDTRRREALWSWIGELESEGLEALALLRDVFLSGSDSTPGIVSQFAQCLAQLRAVAAELPEFVSSAERGFAGRGREIWSAGMLLAFLAGVRNERRQEGWVDDGSVLDERVMSLNGAFVALTERVQGFLVGATLALREAEAGEEGDV